MTKTEVLSSMSQMKRLECGVGRMRLPPGASPSPRQRSAGQELSNILTRFASLNPKSDSSPHPSPLRKGRGGAVGSPLANRGSWRGLEFGQLEANSMAEHNPLGWQRVAGGRAGQRGNDHRKGVGWSSTPERGARPNHVRTARPFIPGRLPRSSHSNYLALGQSQSRVRAAATCLAPRRGAGPLPRHCSEVAAPQNPRRPPATVWQPSGLAAPEWPISSGALGIARPTFRSADDSGNTPSSCARGVSRVS